MPMLIASTLLNMERVDIILEDMIREITLKFKGDLYDLDDETAFYKQNTINDGKSFLP